MLRTLNVVLIAAMLVPRLAAPALDRVTGADEETQALIDEAFRREVELAELLWTSSDPEQLLVGGLLAERPIEVSHAAAEYYARALDGDPHDVAILQNLVRYCLRSTAPPCGDPRLARYAELDADNGMAWLFEAVSAHHENDEDAVAAALRRAADAPDFDDYSRRYMAMLDRVLRAWQPMPAGEHVALVIGMQSLPISWQGPFDVCRARAAADATTRDACLAIGERMATSADSTMTELIGLSLVVEMLEVEPVDAERLAAAKERRAAVRARVSDEARDNVVLFGALPPGHPYWYELLGNWLELGESRAQALAREDLAALLATDGGAGDSEMAASELASAKRSLSADPVSAEPLRTHAAPDEDHVAHNAVGRYGWMIALGLIGLALAWVRGRSRR